MRTIPGISRHARERMIERLGFDPPATEWMRAVLSILDRTACLRSMDSRDGRETWRVEMAGYAVDVVWMPAEGLMVTVLGSNARLMHPRQRMERQAAARRNRIGGPQQRRDAWRREVEGAGE